MEPTIKLTPNNNLESQNKKLLADLQESLKDQETLRKVTQDYNTTFNRLGAPRDQASQFTKSVISYIESAKNIKEAEQDIKTFFENNLAGNKTIFQRIESGLQKRFEIIFEQLKNHLADCKGKTIDYGCGSAILTQMFHDRLGMDIEGVDVRDFKGKDVTVPVRVFDGYKVPVPDKYYDAAVLTNVIHHEKDNEKILQELDRIVSRKLVIIETVPEAADAQSAKKDWGRMLLNDTLWNRFFNYADIPVPGTYETPERWMDRFVKYGWRPTHSEDLGMDQPTIQDRHHLLVFER